MSTKSKEGFSCLFKKMVNSSIEMIMHEDIPNVTGKHGHSGKFEDGLDFRDLSFD